MQGRSGIAAAPDAAELDPRTAARRLSDFGFLASPDLPNRPGPAFLLVALRAVPTFRHYDPELVDYWVTDAGRGVRRTLTRETRMPLTTEFSWGLIRLADRLKVTNEYLTFGGTLRAEAVGDVVAAVFTSPVPLLRRGGHSQGLDPGAEALGAWFGRLLLAVDYVRGFERLAAEAGPVAHYTAFLDDTVERYRASPSLRTAHPELWTLFGGEARRVRVEDPEEARTGDELRAPMESGVGRATGEPGSRLPRRTTANGRAGVADSSHDRRALAGST